MSSSRYLFDRLIFKLSKFTKLKNLDKRPKTVYNQ